MNSYIKEQHEIDIKHLIAYLLKKWVIILLAGALLGMIFGGYKYLSAIEASRDESDNDSNVSLDYDALYSSYLSSQNSLDSAMQGIYSSISSQNDYFNESILYRLDCNSAPTTMLGYELVLSSENYENLTDLVYNYYLYGVANGDYLSDLALQLNTEPQYIHELIVVDRSVSEIIPPADNSSYSIVCSLVVTVNGLDKAMCDVIADSIELEIEELYLNDPLNSQYSIDPAFRTYATVHSNRIMNAQDIENNHYDNLFLKLRNYSGYKNNISAPISNGKGNDLGLKSLIKTALVGFVLGIGLICFAFVGIYIFNDKVSDYERFNCRYSLANLGLNSDMIIANIKLSIAEGSDIVFCSTVGDSDVSAFINSIKSDLRGYEVESITNLIDNSGQRIKLNKSNNIVIVEKKRKSKYIEIDEEMRLLSDLNKKVIGVILI